MSFIEVCGVSHCYDGSTKVLDGISFGVEKGEFLSVLGASGSGKTTLLSIMGGIERPTAGKVFIDGAEITERKSVSFFSFSISLLILRLNRTYLCPYF